MENSKIEWTHHTFNPWWGCVKVSPECDHCYAADLDNRYHKGEHWGKDSPRKPASESYWKQPIKWNRDAERAGERRRVFCGSMMDIGERRSYLDTLRPRVWTLAEETPYLDWLFLTKRPQELPFILPTHWCKEPRKNVWLMTTVGHPDWLWRIGDILKVPAVVHGLSAEPLLGPLDIRKYLDRLNWVICGGESGPNARPMHLRSS